MPQTTKPTSFSSHRHAFSVAPMLDWTDRHCRYFHRQLSDSVLLYTEMVTTGAIIYGKYDLLEYNREEHPVALQLGGSDIKDLAHCARLAAERGYDEINLNVGCPSDRVQNGRFGACLMAEPQLVADCIKAMQDAVPDVPVTVKTRLGIDEHDSYEFLCALLDRLTDVSCPRVILHARKAWLQGLSPKENRDIPELNYDRVYQAKRDYPHFDLHINGGVQTLEEAKRHLAHVDGVMIGRAAYQNPWMLQEIDSVIGGRAKVQERFEVVERMIPYIEGYLAKGGRFWHVVRHMLGLYQGLPGARQWRRLLSEQGPRANSIQPLLDGQALLLEQAQRTAEHVASFSERLEGEVKV
ncbi:tRNA dihydrouridine(20/20a) synthase DusA [Aliidiomarina taiwanensis]|uniref:tRNA-dihydrouridine(20/20a) synthase n=1 Tax=Aliidiomarina taiwanensis TaxID=946228 RepID=A0A432X054_9GAMM|nr:tRNA dihydrouridine(20/20a) synthase DusA [Aliidiomarina taiwanensis]RUO39400.1 tRNA dihydrouridine(20/20a) synthase DusA [Aliidiomarina taiwanensis]